MQINIKEVPFSFRGSYMAISYCNSTYPGTGKEGIYLRCLHGSAKNRNVCRLVPLLRHAAAEYTITADEAVLTLQMQGGKIEICFADDGVLLFRGIGEHTGLLLDTISDGSGYNYLHPLLDGDFSTIMLNSYTANCRYLSHCQAGELQPEQAWEAEKTSECALKMIAANGLFLVSLTEVPTEWRGNHVIYDFEDCAAHSKSQFQIFRDQMPAMPESYKQSAELAAYINWSAIVKPFGFLKRESMFMSKNWMCNVWSWDHCFNAMLLAYGHPELAWDQFMSMFDYQDTTGVIPDSINDAIVVHNFCKPPVHGWALSHILKRMKLDDEQLLDAYNKLSRWTEWWLNYRDCDGDGLCEYFHGNDSGWDNATAFRELPPMLLPDLNAFLILQMDVLADIASLLGNIANQKTWKSRADQMLDAFCKKCFRNGHPVALHSGSYREVENDSLILYLPVILGDRLPEDLRKNIVTALTGSQFLTDYGMATESPQSRHYISDGYWRGPIWAPSTMLIVDGLLRCGEITAAKDIARRFCEMVKISGCAENFNALTGEGLRDRAYTWTSSVFMILAHDYL